MQESLIFLGGWRGEGCSSYGSGMDKDMRAWESRVHGNEDVVDDWRARMQKGPLGDYSGKRVSEASWEKYSAYSLGAYIFPVPQKGRFVEYKANVTNQNFSRECWSPKEHLTGNKESSCDWQIKTSILKNIRIEKKNKNQAPWFEVLFSSNTPLTPWFLVFSTSLLQVKIEATGWGAWVA